MNLLNKPHFLNVNIYKTSMPTQGSCKATKFVRRNWAPLVTI